MVRPPGFEPGSSTWQADVLVQARLRPRNSRLQIYKEVLKTFLIPVLCNSSRRLKLISSSAKSSFDLHIYSVWGKKMVNRGAKEGNVAEALEKLRGEIIQLRSKLEEIIEMDRSILRSLRGQKEAQIEEALDLGALDVMTLLALPDHLRKTAMVICRRNAATASEVAEETGRARAVESGYLNQLVNLGHVKKKRDGRKVYFYIEKEESKG